MGAFERYTKDRHTAMKKSTRATIAGVAGLSLLAGGATFAYWNSEADVPGATIASGSLTLTSAGDGTWTDVTGGGSTEVTDISTYTVVPGTELEYTESYTIAATGDNLSADLGTSGVVNASTGELADGAVAVDSVFTLEGDAVADSITSDNGGEVVAVTVSVDVDPALDGEVGQLDSLVLNPGEVTLTQTPPQQPVV